MSEHLMVALASVFDPVNFSFLILGVAAGIIVGALPGLTATMALALLVPFTFTMEPGMALMVLGGVYVGDLRRVHRRHPGQHAGDAVRHCHHLRRLPSDQKGKSRTRPGDRRLQFRRWRIFGAIVLLLLTPRLAEVALKFGPPEYFWLAVFGLTIIVTLSTGSMLKGLMGGAFGVLLSTIGIAPIGGDMRLTFGFHQMQAGVELIVALIGFFCIPEVLKMIERKYSRYDAVTYKPRKGVAKSVMLELIKKPVLLLRSSTIGCFVGIVPGAGGNIAAWSPTTRRCASPRIRVNSARAPSTVWPRPNRPITPKSAVPWCRCSPWASPAPRRRRSSWAP